VKTLELSPLLELDLHRAISALTRVIDGELDVFDAQSRRDDFDSQWVFAIYVLFMCLPLSSVIIIRS